MRDEWKTYEAACNGIETPRSDTKEFFFRFSACKDGKGENLYGLHLLDNTDKHTVLTPIVGVAIIPHVKVVYPNGKIMAEMKNTKLGMGPDGRARFMRMGPGLSIEFDQNADPTIDIFFGNVDFFQRLPIIPTLMELSNAVSDVLRKFEEFVKTRK